MIHVILWNAFKRNANDSVFCVLVASASAPLTPRPLYSHRPVEHRLHASSGWLPFEFSNPARKLLTHVSKSFSAQIPGSSCEASRIKCSPGTINQNNHRKIKNHSDNRRKEQMKWAFKGHMKNCKTDIMMWFYATLVSIDLTPVMWWWHGNLLVRRLSLIS